MTLSLAPIEEAGGLQGEPCVRDMLADPIVRSLMQRDGVTAAEIRRLLREKSRPPARSRRQGYDASLSVPDFR